MHFGNYIDKDTNTGTGISLGTVMGKCGKGPHFKETWQTKIYQGTDEICFCWGESNPWEAQMEQKCFPA
jgi:hypothetical protein